MYVSQGAGSCPADQWSQGLRGGLWATGKAESVIFHSVAPRGEQTQGSGIMGILALGSIY